MVDSWGVFSRASRRPGETRGSLDGRVTRPWEITFQRKPVGSASHENKERRHGAHGRKCGKQRKAGCKRKKGAVCEGMQIVRATFCPRQQQQQPGRPLATAAVPPTASIAVLPQLALAKEPTGRFSRVPLSAADGGSRQLERCILA